MSDTKTIIIATDGSDQSLRILPHAQRFADSLGGDKELVRILEPADVVEGGDAEGSTAIERTRAHLEADMANALKRVGAEATIRVVVAPDRESPAQTLLRQVAGCDLLAMFSHGRSGIARLLQGSVAMGVLKDIEVPVMLGGPDLLAPPADGATYRLLATTDLSPDADEALRAVAPLLEQGKFEVTLVYVHFHAPGGVDNAAEVAKHTAALNEKRKLLPASLPVETQIREIPIGAGVDTAILEEADKIGAQAILMATHGHSARRHLLMGSVAMSVLRRSRLPLIVSRARA